LFQCFIDYRQGQKEFIQWDDIEMQFESFQNLKLGYDVALDIVEDPRGTSVHILKVRKDLYDQAGAEKMIRSYERLVHSYASSPAVLLDDPDMFDPTESNDMIKLSQGTPTHLVSKLDLRSKYFIGPSLSSRWPLTVVHQFVEVSHQQPRSIAVINADNTIISYSTLSLQARTIATALISAGVKSGSHVAVLQEVTHHWVASILGIWHIGAIYVPLDLGLPSYRHVAIVRDSRPSVILVDDSTLAGSVKISGSESIIIDVTKLNDEMGHQAPPIVADGSARCAILYTSGSTGTPKGVILKHIGLRNFSEMTPPLLGVGSEIVLQQTSSVFDLSLIQITTALCHGGCLCLIPWNRRGDAVHISRVMLQHNVTFTCATPSEYCTWIDHGRCQLSQCANWRMAFCIGEPIPKFLPGQMSTVSPNVRLYNLYGPCETSLAATAMEVPLSTDPWHSAIPAGTPLPNYSVYIVDTKLRPVPIGVQGEIYIGGVGVGAGYLNKPALTAEKFVPDIFAKCADTANGAPLLHRTGDLGRWSSEGTLLVERRVAGDKQIKLRGIRIDLGEIEDTIVRAANPAVHQAVVTVSSSLSETDTFLRAHVVFGEAIKEDDMKGWIVAINSSLGNVLPQYMCPAIITPVQSLPRMNSGKIDRQAVAALPLPATIVNRESEDNSDLTDTEKRLSLLWQELLVLESSATSEYNILPQTDFFHIGGTSLRLLNLQARIREVFHVEVSILSMFEHSTLAGIARWIEGSGHESSSLAPDWDADTSLPPDLRDVRQLASINSTEPVKPGKIVVLTGATGAVGKMLLKALQLDEEVEEIHCIAVRDAANRQQICRGGKVTLYQGDLALPNLGLSKEDAQFIFSRASTIVHNGAEVSYLKTYRSLYGANVRSTKELIRLCLPRVVAFHYISSTAVETGEGSDASGRPRGGPLAGLGSGYTMSKQVSEAFLQNLKSRYSGWPIWIHRPSLISDKDRNGGGPNSVIESIQRYSKTLRAIPVMPRDQMGLSGLGIFNVVPMHVVVRGVLDAVMMPEGAEIPDSIQICRHVGNSEINMENLRGWASETGPEVEEEENSETVKEMKVSEWAAKAGELGMDPTIVVFMKAVATDMGLN
jgi:amino acid adenylation domain-containing protein